MYVLPPELPDAFIVPDCKPSHRPRKKLLFDPQQPRSLAGRVIFQHAALARNGVPRVFRITRQKSPVRRARSTGTIAVSGARSASPPADAMHYNWSNSQPPSDALGDDDVPMRPLDILAHVTTAAESDGPQSDSDVDMSPDHDQIPTSPVNSSVVTDLLGFTVGTPVVFPDHDSVSTSVPNSTSTSDRTGSTTAIGHDMNDTRVAPPAPSTARALIQGCSGKPVAFSPAAASRTLTASCSSTSTSPSSEFGSLTTIASCTSSDGTAGAIPAVRNLRSSFDSASRVTCDDLCVEDRRRQLLARMSPWMLVQLVE